MNYSLAPKSQAHWYVASYYKIAMAVAKKTILKGKSVSLLKVWTLE